MKFDVIVGNPPYQLSTGGSKSQAIPIYNLFVEQAKKLNPRYLTMIIPSRWFAGGMGLDNFRKNMLMDKRISHVVDYTNAKDCFPGISLGGGVNYFLWERNYSGKCTFVNIHDGIRSTRVRSLDEYEVFIRFNEALDIVNKVNSFGEKKLDTIVSSLSPFGLKSSVRGKDIKLEGSYTVYSSAGKGYLSKNQINKGVEYINNYKLMVSKVTSEHAGEPGKDGKFKVISKIKILKPYEVCTFSYFLIGNSSCESDIVNLKSYLKTKFARFLLLQSISSINISKEKFRFVPIQDFSKPWTDKELYEKYNLTEEEIEFIESLIKPMD